MGEWFKPAVLKTADVKASVSSNLTLSADSLALMGLSDPFDFLPTTEPADYQLVMDLWKVLNPWICKVRVCTR